MENILWGFLATIYLAVAVSILRKMDDKIKQKLNCFLSRVPEKGTFEDFERPMDHLAHDISSNSGFNKPEFESYSKDISIYYIFE